MLAKKITAGALLGVIASTGEAWAYLDPGAGSFAVQALIGVVATAGVAVKLFWRRLADRLRAGATARLNRR